MGQEKKIIPLQLLVDFLLGQCNIDLDHSICITFDDGPDFDFYDLEYPGLGLQRSFLNILNEFQEEVGDKQPKIQATSFVIASPEARTAIDNSALLGKGWLSDNWWRKAEQSSLIEIQNHSWDHRHPSLANLDRGDMLGNFWCVDDFDSCKLQVIQAGKVIRERLGGKRPNLFAYPYGQASDYLRHEFFPHFIPIHGIRAAFSTQPEYVHKNSERWFLPRFAFLEHWQSGMELEAIIRGKF
ncbi:polysaccharide deacetylase family protein [Nitrosococcus wardiae]|uniref:Polysaccharide deacetylase family protein n=1 Tax=Nitrosococcus wardiae TaxID=1814290 RepID=A0A4V1AVL1_9GAMM|nr:polysaccharide deacetylase family protein [Nitrosococcus wardiae]QBQ53515.1 polysaccharide deacetylase family protein [Nitrosococcus wardiae]